VAIQLKPYGVTPQQFNILRILRGQHPKPAKVQLLQERMLDKMSNASRLVERLRNKGLVERKICKMDRRAVDVIITESGLNLLRKLDGTEQNWINMFQIIDSNEALRINNVLDLLRSY
jgi:DNA-binding MarR family transcriptional regulator